MILCKKERVKAKISKLLALAASTRNPHEAKSANSKAMAYMTEYRLTVGDIERASLRRMEFEHTGIKISQCDAVMATSIAKVLGVNVLFLQGFSAVKGLFFYVGEPSDIEFARYVYEVASAQINKKAKAHRLSLGGASTKYMNSYRNGLKMGFTTSFEDSYKVDYVTESSNNTGLIALNDRYALACKHAGDNFKQDKRKIRPDRASAAGYSDSKDINVSVGVDGESLAPKKLGFSL